MAANAVARLNPEYERLGGRQKAAILCLTIGSEAAAKITSKLSPEEAEAITFEIARVDPVSAETVEQVVNEWIESMLGVNSMSSGGVEFAREVLEKAFGSAKAKQILGRIQTQLADTAGLHRLRKADPQQLGTMLRGEHPQTIALVLAHLDPGQTAAVLKELGHELGAEVMYRMAGMQKVSPEMLQLVERSIGAETDFAQQGMSVAGGPAAVAAVLNLCQGSLEKALLEGMEARDKAITEQIKNLMFVFEDIITLDDKAIQRLLREIEAKSLALSLKAASDELRAKMLGQMSQRARDALQEEMEMMGPVRMRDVEAAQATIVAQVRKLEEAGEIVISSGGDNDVLL